MVVCVDEGMDEALGICRAGPPAEVHIGGGLLEEGTSVLGQCLKRVGAEGQPGRGGIVGLGGAGVQAEQPHSPDGALFPCRWKEHSHLVGKPVLTGAVQALCM
jgi:hypothetical protein